MQDQTQNSKDLKQAKKRDVGKRAWIQTFKMSCTTEALAHFLLCACLYNKVDINQIFVCFIWMIAVLVSGCWIVLKLHLGLFV